MSETIPKGRFGYNHLDLQSDSGADKESSAVRHAMPLGRYVKCNRDTAYEIPIFKCLCSSLNG